MLIPRSATAVIAVLGLASVWGQDAPVVRPTDSPAEQAVPTAGVLPLHLTLTMAEELLLTHHAGIAASRALGDAALANEDLAGYRPNPTLSLSAEQFDAHSPRAHLASDSGKIAQRFYTVHLEQQFERGGKRALRVRGAVQQRLGAEAAGREVVRQARLALAQAFIAALLARDNFVVAEENVALGATTEQVVAHQVEGGNRSAAELLSVQVNRVQYLQDRETARVGRDQALQDIAALLGMPAPAGFSADGDLAEVPEVPVGDLSALAEARSDVEAAHHALEAARSAIALAEAQRSVDPTLGVEYQRNGPDNTFGFTASFPLPAWNNHAADIRQAEALQRQAEIQYAQARRQAEADIAKALQGYTSSRAVLELYSQQTLAKAKRALEIATTAYKGGATSYLEVIDAQRTSNQILVAANQALANVRLAAAQLEFAVGRRLTAP
jgi:cobalt-zinc-cadmium efflux system outer membrane protein